MVGSNHSQHPLPLEEYKEPENEVVLDLDDDIVEHIVATIDVGDTEPHERS